MYDCGGNHVSGFSSFGVLATYLHNRYPGLTEGDFLLHSANFSAARPIQLHKNKSGILAQLIHHRSHRPGHFWAGAAVVGVSLFSTVAALGTVNEAPPTQITQQQVVERLALPALPAAADSDQSFLHEDRVQRCLLYTSPSPRDRTRSRMPSSA